MQHLGKILPIEAYEVQLADSLPTDYTKSLMHLYQPLLGIEAISLYQLLLHEIDLQSEENLQTHHTLMNYLNMPLDRIYEARLKLEGIGLLKSFKRETEERVFYTYLLQAPFSPEHFFQDVMLSELLYRHIGQSKFKSLQAFYTKRTKQASGKNITASFNDVFQTFEPTNYVPLPVTKEKSTGIPLEQIDFKQIEQALKRKMIPVDKVLTEANKEIISKLMHLYGLETYEIENAMNWALTDENRLDIAQFKAACHDLFQAKHNVANVKLSVKQPVGKKEFTPKKELSKEEQLVERLEKISPKQLLEDLSTGNNASEQDMKLISKLMIKQGLPAPVMNVLIHYVLLQSNMQLSKAYLEKIASHWSRAQLKTAKEAMEFAKDQTNKATKPRKNYQSRKKSTEVIPDWFKERENQSKQENRQEAVLTKEQEKEQAELIALLKRHASKNN